MDPGIENKLLWEVRRRLEEENGCLAALVAESDSYRRALERIRGVLLGSELLSEDLVKIDVIVQEAIGPFLGP